MSFVNRIPPLVSALAFGYGVGMAAPESTLAQMRAAARAAVAESPAERDFATRRRQAVLPQRTAGIQTTGLSGDESRELARLREVAVRDDKRGASFDDEPRSSRTPRNQSLHAGEMATGRDMADADVDDLDAAGADALSKLQLPDMRVGITRRTLKYVKFFTRTERGRGMFETWLKRSGRYQEMIQGELRQRHLPEDLIWVAMIESGFDPRAKSPAGAVGLWQFMPSTGSVYGLVQSAKLDQRRNPRLATQAAAHHLRDLYMRFGSWDLALAAYNMGYEQLLDAIDKYGTADFSELSRQMAVPEETASYVPKIAAAAIVSNNLERFGFDRVELSRPVDAAEIAVPPGTPLKILARAAGVATSQIRTLNPDFLGERVPPGRGDFLVMIPPDTVSRAQAALPAMLENEPIVTDEAAVLDPVNLLPGSELLRRHHAREDESLLGMLPHYKKRRSLRDEVVEDAIGANDEPSDDVEAPSRSFDDDAPRPRHHRTNRETVVYKVAPGDTLVGIARQFAMDVDDVSKSNHVDGDDNLKVGALLKLRVRKDLVEGVAAKDDAKKKDDPAARPRHREHHDHAGRSPKD
jgi:membrane-bound lytic murein transglycosylase D